MPGTMRFARSLFVAALPAAFLLHVEDARACSAMCATPKLAPAAGSLVPASAPALPVFGGAASASTIELRTASGDLVAGTFGNDPKTSRPYFLPASPLAPGEYEATSQSSCGGQSTITSAFTVTAAAPLPVVTGSLGVKRAFRESTSVATSAGSCVAPVDAAMVDLDLTIDPALMPYTPIVAWETEVDGKWWYGREGGAPAAADSSLGRSLLRLFTACDGITPSGRDQGLAPGTHEVSVRAVLVGGAKPIAPATLRVKVTCGADNGTLEGFGDGEIAGSGSASGDGWEGSGGGGRSSTSSSSSSGASRPRGQDGCTAAPQGAASGASSPASFAAVGIVVAALRRRKNAMR